MWTEAPLIKERGVNPQSGVYGPLLASLEPDGKVGNPGHPSLDDALRIHVDPS